MICILSFYPSLYVSIQHINSKNVEGITKGENRGNFFTVKSHRKERKMTKGKSSIKNRDRKRKLSMETKTPLVAAIGEKNIIKRKNSVSENSVSLQSDVKSINEKMMKEGQRQFFTRLPEKIIELTEYIQVSFVLFYSPSHYFVDSTLV